MSQDISKEVALAAKITAKAEDTLSGIEREMRIMKWPEEFKAIMWEAIAHMALARAALSQSAAQEGGAAVASNERGGEE